MTKVKVRGGNNDGKRLIFYEKEIISKIIQHFSTKYHNIISDSKFLAVIYHYFFVMHVSDFHLSILPYKWQMDMDTDDHTNTKYLAFSVRAIFL